jgi:hypothetical protein
MGLGHNKHTVYVIINGRLQKKECNFPTNQRNKLNLKRKATWKANKHINSKIPSSGTTKSILVHGGS